MIIKIQIPGTPGITIPFQFKKNSSRRQLVLTCKVLISKSRPQPTNSVPGSLACVSGTVRVRAIYSDTQILDL